MSMMTESPDFARGRADVRAETARTVEPISETMRRWEADKWLARNDPFMSLLLRAEAIAGHRAENHVCEASKLPMIRDVLREAIELHTGKPFRNPIFP